MEGKRYKHLGYYNQVGDIMSLSRKSAEEIVAYWQKGFGAFYPSYDHDPDTDIVPEKEARAIAFGDLKFTKDGEYATLDSSWSSWDEWEKTLDESTLDDDDSECYIDIYKLIK